LLAHAADPVRIARISEVRHPIFARFFARLSKAMEREVGRHRTELLGGLSGRVVEVGAGNGMNFAHYPQAVEEVIAIEPEPYLRARAEQAARAAPVPVRLMEGVAGDLPLESGSVDAAVASLVLCTIPDAAGALAEMRRVLKPGGELRFLEHVRSDHPRKARVQRISDGSGIWPLIGGGCHCSRETLAAIRAAGYTVGDVHELDFGPSWWITNPHVLGVARAPQ
jgi:ubiquinone/menaquinone biosynthesis C-methylase UbiE